MKVIKGPPLSDWLAAYRARAIDTLPPRPPGFETTVEISKRIGKPRTSVCAMLRRLGDKVERRDSATIMADGRRRKAAVYKLK
jgi:hypothetical protein